MQSTEDEVSRERCLNRHFTRFRVANLTHQNRVGGLSQHRFDDASKVETNAVLHLHLIDPRQIILHRVLSRDDLAVRTVQFAKCRIQSCRFAGTRGTGHQKNAVRTTNNVLKGAVIVVAETQIADPNLDVVAVQNTHDQR